MKIPEKKQDMSLCLLLSNLYALYCKDDVQEKEDLNPQRITLILMLLFFLSLPHLILFEQGVLSSPETK